jgi:polyisoprenoid-binding protein YceI
LVADAIIVGIVVLTNIANAIIYPTTNLEHLMAAVQIPQTQALPPAGTWALDTTHTEAAFTARHLMVTKVRGRFAVSSGAVTIAENPLESSVEATLDVASVHSGDAGRDQHLLSPDFFDVENYPTITFRSTKVTAAGDGEYKLTGELTIRDVTRPVTLDLEYLGTIDSPFGDTRAGFSASTEISRKDWGLDFNMALEAGGVVVSDKVKINIDAETILQK